MRLTSSTSAGAFPFLGSAERPANPGAGVADERRGGRRGQVGGRLDLLQSEHQIGRLLDALELRVSRKLAEEEVRALRSYLEHAQLATRARAERITASSGCRADTATSSWRGTSMLAVSQGRSHPNTGAWLIEPLAGGLC